MTVSVTDQAIDFLAACLIGAAMGFLYDGFRILRIAVPCRKAAVFFQDVLFFFICGIVTFLFLLLETDGSVRLFVLAGELIGALLYFLALSAHVMRFGRFSVDAGRRFWRRIRGYLEPPVRRTCGKIDRIVHIGGKNAKKLWRNNGLLSKIRLKVDKIMLYNLLKVKREKNTGKRTDVKDRRRQRRGKEAQ